MRSRRHGTSDEAGILDRPTTAKHGLDELRNTGIELRTGLVPARGNVNGGARMGYVGNMRAVMNLRTGGHRTVSRKRERSDNDSAG